MHFNEPKVSLYWDSKTHLYKSVVSYICSHVTGGLCGERHNKARESARDTEEVRKRENWRSGPLSKASAPLSFSWHRENIMQPLESIESMWFIAQFETAKLLNCIRSAKIHSMTVEEIWKIKCHLSTVENFYLLACTARNMLHS